MSVSEKIAYLKGLAKGLDLENETSKEARILSAMIDVLDELAAEVSDMDENLNLVNEELDDISDELVAFEEDYYLDNEDDDDDEYYDGDEEEYDDEYDDEDELNEEDGAYYIVECPKCGATMTLDEDTLLAGNIRCESCNQLFSLEVVDENAGDYADEEADYVDGEADDGEPDEIPF